MLLVALSATMASASIPTDVKAYQRQLGIGDPVDVTSTDVDYYTGLSGTGGWPSGFGTSNSMYLDWDITNQVEQDPDHTHTWQYTYTFFVPRVTWVENGETRSSLKSVSHFVLETSEDTTTTPPPDVWGFQVAVNGGAFSAGTDVDFGDFGPGASNPGMPSAIHGVYFGGPDAPDGSADYYTAVYRFFSDRRPVWGDFDAKDGKVSGLGDVAVWNSGLTSEEQDPPPTYQGPDAPYFPGIGGHILVPDTIGGFTPPPVPELPPTLLAVMLPAVGLLMRRLKSR